MYRKKELEDVCLSSATAPCGVRSRFSPRRDTRLELYTRHVLRSPSTTVFHAHYALPSVFRAEPLAKDNRTSSPPKYRPQYRRGPIDSPEDSTCIDIYAFVIKIIGTCAMKVEMTRIRYETRLCKSYYIVVNLLWRANDRPAGLPYIIIKTNGDETR